MDDDESSGTTAAEIAQWMLDQLEDRHWLYQDQTVGAIRREFGDEWFYTNSNGNWAIDKGVLKAFRDLSGDDVIWERGTRAWRKRTDRDRDGRQQD